MGLLAELPSQKHAPRATRVTASSVGAVAAANYAGYAANAASLILSARFLGASGRGGYSALLAWATVCAALSGLSLGAAVARGMAIGLNPKRLLRALPLWWLACSFAGVAVMIGVAAIFLSKTIGNEGALLLSILVIPALVICDWGTYFFQGAGLMRHYAIGRVLPAGLTFLFLAFGTVLGLTLPWAIASFGLANWLVGGWMFSTMRRQLQIRSANGTDDVRMSLLGYGIRSHLGTLAAIANARLDILVLSLLLSLPALGNYSLAVSLTSPIAVIGSSIGAASYRAVGTSDSLKGLTHGIWARFAPPTLALACLACCIAFFVPRAVGSGYADAVIPIFVLAMGTMGLGAIYLAVAILQARGAAGTSSWLFIAAAVISAGTLLVLVPRLGIIGASLSTSITYLTVGVAAFLITYRLGGSWRALAPQHEGAS